MDPKKVSNLVKYLLEGQEVTDKDGRIYLLDDKLNLCVKAFGSDNTEHLMNTFYSLKPLVNLAEEVDLVNLTLNSALNFSAKPKIRPDSLLFAVKIVKGNKEGYIDGPTPNLEELLVRRPPEEEGAKFFIVKLKPNGNAITQFYWSEDFKTWCKISGTGPVV